MEPTGETAVYCERLGSDHRSLWKCVGETSMVWEYSISLRLPLLQKSQDPQKSKGPAYHYHSPTIGEELLFSSVFLQSIGDRSSKVSTKFLYCLRKGSLLLMKALPRVNERHTQFYTVIASCCTWCWQQCQWVRMPVMIHWMPGNSSSSSSFAYPYSELKSVSLSSCEYTSTH